MSLQTDTYAQISKREFYSSGGFANPNLFRKMRGKSWCYYRIYR